MNRPAGNKRPGAPRWTSWARPPAWARDLPTRARSVHPHWETSLGRRAAVSEEGGVTYAADGGQPDSAAVGTASPPARVPATVLAEHQAAVAAIRAAYAALPPGRPVRLAKRTSNLFRFRDPLPGRTAGNRTAPGNGTAPGAAAAGNGTAAGDGAAGDGTAAADGAAAGSGMAAVARRLRAAGSQGRAPSTGTGGLDVSAFTRVLHVDPRARRAVVGGMTTYEDLADATLRHGLMPLVVPQLDRKSVV